MKLSAHVLRQETETRLDMAGVDSAPYIWLHDTSEECIKVERRDIPALIEALKGAADVR